MFDNLVDNVVKWVDRFAPLRAEEPVMDDGRLPIDPQGTSVERLSPLERAIWSEKVKCASNLEVALKLYLYEDVVQRHLQTISRKLRNVPSTVVSAGTEND